MQMQISPLDYPSWICRHLLSNQQETAADRPSMEQYRSKCYFMVIFDDLMMILQWFYDDFMVIFEEKN